MIKKAIFLDRDGTLNKANIINNKSYAPTNPDQMTLFNTVGQTLKLLKKNGFLIIVVSNQPDIALGKINEDTKEKLERKFEELIDDLGLQIDGIFYCNHHPESINPKY